MKNEIDKIVFIDVDVSIPSIVFSILCLVISIFFSSCNLSSPVSPTVSIINSIDSIDTIESIYYDSTSIIFEGKFSGIIDSNCLQCNAAYGKNNEWIIRISSHTKKTVILIKEKESNQYITLEESKWYFNTTAIYIYDPIQQYYNYYYRVVFINQ